MSSKFSPSDFSTDDKLYRGFNISDLVPDTDRLEVNSINFPDFSCNWSRFSEPTDIRKRENAEITDGCYSFTVEITRYKEMATPCHDPVEDNYAHVEVRQLKENESVYFEPPKGRKLKSNTWSKSKRLEYRQNIINNLIIELEIDDNFS